MGRFKMVNEILKEMIEEEISVEKDEVLGRKKNGIDKIDKGDEGREGKVEEEICSINVEESKVK